MIDAQTFQHNQFVYERHQSWNGEEDASATLLIMTPDDSKPLLRLNFIFKHSSADDQEWEHESEKTSMTAEAAYLQDAPVTFLPTLSVIEGTRQDLGIEMILVPLNLNWIDLLHRTTRVSDTFGLGLAF